MMEKKKVEIQAKTVKEVLRYIDEGRFAIPKLQREFVWDGKRAAKLFDSINQRIPIGLIMIWATPKSQRLYLRQKYHVLPPFSAKNTKVWFLIDGQQRISVLYRVREGSKVRNAQGKDIDFSRVVFSLNDEADGEQIRYRKSLAGRYESLCNVLHPQWRHRLNHLGQKRLIRVKKCRDRLLRYSMHFMFVHSKLKDIHETFLRINTQGMKVTTADAIFGRAEALNLRDFRHEVRQHIDETFGQVPEMPILFSMAAVQGGTEARGQALRKVIYDLEEDAEDDLKLRKKLARDWNRLGVCFGKAVVYLRENFCVLTREFLYTDYMIAMLALFFYWNGKGPGSNQKKQIQHWFWATAVGSRYSGVNFNRCLPDDLKFFKRLARNPSANFPHKAQPEKIDVKRANFSSRAGITSAFYCLLLRHQPVSIMDDALNKIPLDRYAVRAYRKDRHHIFPKALLNRADVPANQYNSICNVCLLTAEENQQIGSRRPRSYFREVRDNGKYFRKKMVHHLIPIDNDSGIWSSDIRKGFKQFLRKRSEIICKEFEAEAGIKLFRRDL
jgi:hypothetical protein